MLNIFLCFHAAGTKYDFVKCQNENRMRYLNFEIIKMTEEVFIKIERKKIKLFEAFLHLKYQNKKIE